MRDLLNRAKYLIVAATSRRPALLGALPITPHTIDRWDEATGQNLIERIALVAVETYRAAVESWPGAKITLRNRARVIEQSRED